MKMKNIDVRLILLRVFGSTPAEKCLTDCPIENITCELYLYWLI